MIGDCLWLGEDTLGGGHSRWVGSDVGEGAGDGLRDRRRYGDVATLWTEKKHAFKKKFG